MLCCDLILLIHLLVLLTFQLPTCSLWNVPARNTVKRVTCKLPCRIKIHASVFPDAAKTCARMPGHPDIIISGIPLNLLNLLTNNKKDKNNKDNKNNKYLFCLFSGFSRNKHLLTNNKFLLTKITKNNKNMLTNLRWKIVGTRNNKTNHC